MVTNACVNGQDPNDTFSLASDSRPKLPLDLFHIPARLVCTGLRGGFNGIALSLRNRHQTLAFQLVQQVAVGFRDGCLDGGGWGAGDGGVWLWQMSGSAVIAALTGLIWAVVDRLIPSTTG